MPQIDLFVEPDLARLFARQLDPQRVVLRREQAGEREDCAARRHRIVDDIWLAVHLDAVALGERRTLAELRVFLKVDDVVEDLLDAGVGLLRFDFVSHIEFLSLGEPRATLTRP